MDKNPLWKPSQEQIDKSNMMRFINYVNQNYNQSFSSYNELYDWSVTKIPDFWEALFDYCDVIHSKSPDNILDGTNIRTAKWFSGAKLNFAENLLKYRDDNTALIYLSEDKDTQYISYSVLYKKVAQTAQALKQAGIQEGDRVAAFITNRPEAIITMLAASSIGAIYSSCSPDFGFQGVLDRFGQIKPKILVAVDGYSYNGKWFDKSETIEAISENIQSIEKIIVLNSDDDSSSSSHYQSWESFIENDSDEITFEQLPFDHPLYIMYSSGTTGKPKCIVHGGGGTLLQHLKEHILHTNLTRDDVITYYTTCGWMMWNWLVSSLAVGAQVLLYDGSPAYPSTDYLFQLIDDEKISIFGTSPKFLSACENHNLSPKDDYALDSLKVILSTGAPLSADNFNFVYERVKEDVQLSSISGGTDIVSCFMLGNPILPVYAEELQCRGLGMKVETFDDNGNSITNEVGELVCTAPFPSRPIYFWNDDDNSKYKSAYFEHFPEIWRHGDFIKINKRGGVIVYGRSDATLNPGGVRIGTSEIYGPVETLNEVENSIVVGLPDEDDTKIVLFVILKENLELDENLKDLIRNTLKKERTPRHIPKEIYQVSDIPHTLNGKKVELSVTKILSGKEIKNKDALANPDVLDEYLKVYKN